MTERMVASGTRRRRPRASWWLASLALIASFTWMRVRRDAVGPSPPGAEESSRGVTPFGTPGVAGGWRGKSEGRFGVGHVLLVQDPSLERMRSVGRRWSEGLGLGAGRWMRLVLQPDGSAQGPGPALRASPWVGDRRVGRTLGELLAESGEPFESPLLTLLAAELRGPGPDGPTQATLYCEEPGEGLRLRLELTEGASSTHPEPERMAEIELVGRDEPGDEAPGWFLRTARLGSSQAAADDGERVARLEAELARARERERELAERLVRNESRFLEFQQGIGKLELPGLEAALGLAPQSAAEEAEDPAPEPEPTPEELRLAELVTALRTLMRAEGVHGLDLLEAGGLGEGALGPVVFRTLDDRGRLTGGLVAQRLRLEGSRAARTLTLVLEEGHETHGGLRTEFDERRITLPFVDPDPWLADLPELFAEENALAERDDGLWDLREVRYELNRLLGLDATHGFYRLHSLGGVLGESYVDVHLEEFDREGHVRRRFFADRMSIALGGDGAPGSAGVELVLEDGAILRGEQKLGFTNGRHVIRLPAARQELWRAAELPAP